jgi:DNA-directed RNA polymerase subunit M/transcription elongation factor TFIIS
MRFCSLCQTMYRMSIDPSTSVLKHVCPKCGNQETIDSEALVVSEINVSAKQEVSSYLINKYTKYDPTLPRTEAMDCPNPECGSNKGDEPKEIIYLRYDETNLRYLYLCCVCDTHWKLSR